MLGAARAAATRAAATEPARVWSPDRQARRDRIRSPRPRAPPHVRRPGVSLQAAGGQGFVRGLDLFRRHICRNKTCICICISDNTYIDGQADVNTAGEQHRRDFAKNWWTRTSSVETCTKRRILYCLEHSSRVCVPSTLVCDPMSGSIKENLLAISDH